MAVGGISSKDGRLRIGSVALEGLPPVLDRGDSAQAVVVVDGPAGCASKDRSQEFAQNPCNIKAGVLDWITYSRRLDRKILPQPVKTYLLTTASCN